MRHVLHRLVLLTLFTGVANSPATAQNGQQIFDFFANQMDREIARQQQRQNQRQQQQQNNLNYQIFLAAWNDCFEKNDLSRCDFALTFPSGAEDQQRLLVKRTEIIAAEQTQQDQVRRERAEQAALERQQRIEAANEARRLRLEQEQEAARLRQQEVERQRTEVDTARRARVAEERRAAQLRLLVTALDGCRRYDVDSCDRALASEYANNSEFASVRSWRDAALALRADRAACQSGTIEACDRALASPAATDGDRAQLTDWRTAASPVNRAIAVLSAYASTALVAAQTLPAMFGELPLSTQITGGVAAVLALALVAVVMRSSPTARTDKGQSAPPPLPVLQRRRRRFSHGMRRWLHRATVRFLARRRAARQSPAKPTPAPANQAQPPPIPAVVAKTQPPPLPNSAALPPDTETAVDAMQLVLAYMAEFQGEIGNALTNPAYAAKSLNTLSLISRQLDIAERADASATITVEDKDGEHVLMTISAMKANAIFTEAMCWMADNPKWSIKLLEHSLELAPDGANAYFCLGMVHADMLNKRDAVAALEKAVALDPRNMDYRKELLRAQSISGGQVAYDRAASGVRTSINVAKFMWYGFWVVATIALVAALARGDQYTAGGVLLVFAIFAFAKQCIVWLKSWFAETF